MFAVCSIFYLKEKLQGKKATHHKNSNIQRTILNGFWYFNSASYEIL